MESVKIAIGKRIKELRVRQGISQEKLANLAELDRTYVTSDENGRRNISIVNIVKICKALHTPLYVFFTSDFFESYDD